VLAVLGLVALGRLPQDLGDFLLELDQGAVGPTGGVGGHLGPVEGDHADPDHAGRRAQLQRLDEEASERLLVADAEAGEGHVVRGLVGGQDAEGEVLGAAPFELPGGAHPRQ
jgi:hypothetical protein